jgi:large subunit ribosomal protein L25
MEIVKLSASKRAEHGKGPSRRLRAEGKIPAVAYGKKLVATQLAVSPKQLKAVLASSHGRNSVIELDVDGGEKITAMVREYSHDPVSREILHADFLQVDLGSPVDVVVPFRLEGKAKGLVLGGLLAQVFRTLPVRCLPTQIPSELVADVSDLGLGDALKASQLKLPEGVVVRLPADQTIASVTAPEKVEETPAEAAKAAAPAKGAAAAKAAPAAAAAKKK